MGEVVGYDVLLNGGVQIFEDQVGGFGLVYVMQYYFVGEDY